jgi:hypothetical protein
MGAAWRGLEGRKNGFERILKMVSEVRGMGMEGECEGENGKGVGERRADGNYLVDGVHAVVRSLHHVGHVDSGSG